MTRNVLIRGTTPQIAVGFSDVVVEDIKTAYLVIKQCGITILKLGIDRATVEENALVWILTQRETLELKPDRVAIATADWVLTDGTRGRGVEAAFEVENPGVEEAIE